MKKITDKYSVEERAEYRESIDARSNFLKASGLSYNAVESQLMTEYPHDILKYVTKSSTLIAAHFGYKA
jgi:hypothetical protein